MALDPARIARERAKRERKSGSTYFRLEPGTYKLRIGSLPYDDGLYAEIQSQHWAELNGQRFNVTCYKDTPHFAEQGKTCVICNQVMRNAWRMGKDIGKDLAPKSRGLVNVLDMANLDEGWQMLDAPYEVLSKLDSLLSEGGWDFGDQYEGVPVTVRVTHGKKQFAGKPVREFEVGVRKGEVALPVDDELWAKRIDLRLHIDEANATQLGLFREMLEFSYPQLLAAAPALLAIAAPASAPALAPPDEEDLPESFNTPPGSVVDDAEDVEFEEVAAPGDDAVEMECYGQSYTEGTCEVCEYAAACLKLCKPSAVKPVAAKKKATVASEDDDLEADLDALLG